MPKWRVHWIEERHYTAEVECDEVTVERAEQWLREGHPKERDRMEIAQAQEFMQEMDCLMEAKFPDVPVMMRLVEESVSTLEKLEG